MTIAVVVLPLAVREIPREIARWHAAAANEQAMNGDYAAAVASMDKAHVSGSSKTPVWWLLRAQYKLETGLWQSGLDDCDQARRLLPREWSSVNCVVNSCSIWDGTRRPWRSGGRFCRMPTAARRWSVSTNSMAWPMPWQSDPSISNKDYSPRKNRSAS